MQAERLSYEGPFGVGYGVCVYTAAGTDPERNFKEKYGEREKMRILKQRKQEDSYVQLARKTIEVYVRTGERIEMPEGMPEEMYSRRAGVFVSIKEEGRLRGCIGTIQAVNSSIAQEIIDNAISAASRDYRFSPIEAEELELLSVSVDVLGNTEKIESPDKLDVRRYGVIVTKGRKGGCCFPIWKGLTLWKNRLPLQSEKQASGKGKMWNWRGLKWCGIISINF